MLHACSNEGSEVSTQAISAWIEFYPPYNREEAFVGLDGFSHVWLIFQAQKNLDSSAEIGRALVELVQIERDKGKVRLHVEGTDLMTDMPILDIKPYLPYADCIPDATASRE